MLEINLQLKLITPVRKSQLSQCCYLLHRTHTCNTAWAFPLPLLLPNTLFWGEKWFQLRCMLKKIVCPHVLLGDVLQTAEHLFSPLIYFCSVSWGQSLATLECHSESWKGRVKTAAVPRLLIYLILHINTGMVADDHWACQHEQCSRGPCPHVSPLAFSCICKQRQRGNRRNMSEEMVLSCKTGIKQLAISRTNRCPLDGGHGL